MNISNVTTTMISVYFECLFPLRPTYHYPKLCMAICITLLNAFVLFLFGYKKTLQRLPGNYILASLSVNDVMNGTLTILQLTSILYLNDNCLGRQLQYGHLNIPSLFRAVYRIFMLSSVLHLICLSTDRVVYVTYALKYNSIVRRNRVVKIIVLIWMLSCILGGVQLLWSTTYGPWRAFRMKFRLYHTSVLFVLIIVIPSVVLLAQCITMVTIIRRLDVYQRDPRRMAGRKAFILYAVMFLQFVVFAYPYMILNFVFVINGSFINVPHELIEVYLFIRFIPCLLNPCQYALHNKDYRKAINDVVCSVKKALDALIVRSSRLCSVTEASRSNSIDDDRGALRRKSMNAASKLNGFKRMKGDRDGEEKSSILSITGV